MGDEERENLKGSIRIRKIPDALRNSAILPFRGVPRGAVVPRETFRVNAAPQADTLNTRNRTRRGGEVRVGMSRQGP